MVGADSEEVQGAWESELIEGEVASPRWKRSGSSADAKEMAGEGRLEIVRLLGFNKPASATEGSEEEDVEE